MAVKEIKDIEAGQCVLARRDTREKIQCSLEELEGKVEELLFDKCVCCGKPVKKMVYRGRAY